MTCFSFVFKKCKDSQQQVVQYNEGASKKPSVTIFSYKDLRSATGDFSPVNKIGEGGFGCVYKGNLKDGRLAAVKVLSSESRQGVKEFLNELSTISNIVHENLVTLYGCCVEGNHRILVYNYLENNSLAQNLLGGKHNSIQFDWKTRVKICIGVARGLAYLHEEIQPRVVHRDIKAGNILLDRDLTPKISDFGLAKLLPENMTHVSTRVAGTVGYMAPEYAVRGQVTRKSDVYSFGVLLLEIVGGRSNTNTRLHQYLLDGSPGIMHGLLVSQTWLLFERGELETMIDTTMEGSDLDVEEACRFLMIGLMCTQDAPTLRPQMSSVVEMLSGRLEVEPEGITKPGMISDFMDLKIRSQEGDPEASVIAVYSGLMDNSPPMSSTHQPKHTSFHDLQYSN